jgi:hypothetical protein
MKRFFLILNISIFTLVLLYSFSNISYAAYPKLVSTLTSAFESIESWIIRISTPAAAVAVRYRCFYEKI